MTSKKCLQAAIGAALLSVCLLAGCVSVPTTAVSDTAAASELAVMKGSWQPLSRFEDDAVLQDVYAKNAAAMPYYSEGGLKAAVHYAVAAPVIKAVFDGSNTVAFT
ncbi:MAG: hemin-binding protein B, partial [Treponema sp.]